MIRWVLSMFGTQQQNQDDKEKERKSAEEQEKITNEFEDQEVTNESEGQERTDEDDLPALEDDEEDQSRERERVGRKLEEERRLVTEREMAEKLKDLELKLEKEKESYKEAERKRDEERLAKEREMAEKLKDLELKLEKEKESHEKAEKKLEEERLAKEREMAEKLRDLELKLEKEKESHEKAEKKLEEERLAKEREMAEKSKDLKSRLEKEEESRKEAERKLEEERLAKEPDKKVILEYEERHKQKETELLTKIQELARQQVIQLKEEQTVERKRNKEGVASDSLSNVQQKPSEKELLIEALEQIIAHPATVIHSKPKCSETEYHKEEPFKTIEAFVNKLKPSYLPGVSELFEAIRDAQEPLRVNISELVSKFSPKIAGEIPKIKRVEINVYDLDARFGMVSRVERVLDSNALQGDLRSSITPPETSELIFGSSKSGSPVVLQFEALKAGGFKVKKVTQRSIQEYQEGVEQGQGLVLKATKEGTNMYSTQRRLGGKS